jgi:hypothetical protein
MRTTRLLCTAHTFTRVHSSSATATIASRSGGLTVLPRRVTTNVSIRGPCNRNASPHRLFLSSGSRRQLNALRADRETATAMGSDAYIVDKFDARITAYQHVLSGTHETLNNLDTEERKQIEVASTVLRRTGQPRLEVAPADNDAARAKPTQIPQQSQQSTTPAPPGARGGTVRRTMARQHPNEREPSRQSMLLLDGESITFASVARRAQSSTWRVHTDGAKEEKRAVTQLKTHYGPASLIRSTAPRAPRCVHGQRRQSVIRRYGGTAVFNCSGIHQLRY